MASLKSDRRLYVTADRERVVEEGDLDAAFLLVGKNGIIGPSDVARYNLSHKGGKVVLPGEKKAAKPEDKMVAAPEDKAEEAEEWDLKTSPEDYLERFPDGPNAELARRLVED